MKSSEALKIVKENVLGHSDKFFLCFELRNIHATNTPVYKNIRCILGNFPVSSWLTDNVQGFSTWMDNAPNLEFIAIMRDYRLRWIDWLIEGYEAVGD